jgi:hypothetical protein
MGHNPGSKARLLDDASGATGFVDPSSGMAKNHRRKSGRLELKPGGLTIPPHKKPASEGGPRRRETANPQ